MSGFWRGMGVMLGCGLVCGILGVGAAEGIVRLVEPPVLVAAALGFLCGAGATLFGMWLAIERDWA